MVDGSIESRRRARFCLFAALAASLLACREAERRTPDPAVAPVARRPLDDTEPPIEPLAPFVTLLDAGTEPRLLLEYAPATGPRRVDLDLERDDRPYSFVVDWVSEGASSLRWSFEVREARFAVLPGDDEEDLRRMEAIVKHYEGQRAHAAVLDSSRPELPDPGDIHGMPSVGDLLDVLVVPLPPAPIGPGARWIVTRARARGDMQSVESRTYEVEAIDGPRVSIAVHGEARLTRSTPLRRGQGGHIEGRLLIRGTAVIQLDDVLPQSATVTLLESMRSRFPSATHPESRTDAAHHTLDTAFIIRLHAPTPR